MVYESDRTFRNYVNRLTRSAWMGNLRRTQPLSDHWGFDRGTPIDRYYIETFLRMYRSDVRGRVLEVKDDTYTRSLDSGVDRFDVLDINPGNARATITADLAAAGNIDPDQFDCFVLTQTLHLIYDVHAAIAHAHRILRPGGSLLVTVPAVSRITRGYEQCEYWRFTVAGCTELFGSVFGASQVRVLGYGNVLTGIGFLAGLACEDLSRREIDVRDKHFPVLIAVRAVKQ